MNDMSLTDEGAYFTRKIVIGPRKLKKAEVNLYFDNRRNLIDAEIDNGELVDKAAYEEYLEKSQN